MIILVSVLGYFLAFSITTPVIIIYVIVSLAFLIFYIVTVVKIVKKVAKSQNLRQKKTKALTEVSPDLNLFKKFQVNHKFLISMQITKSNF